MVGIKSRQTSMLFSKIKLSILYIINTFRRVLVTLKTNTNIARYFVLGNRLFIFLKIGLRSIFLNLSAVHGGTFIFSRRK